MLYEYDQIYPIIMLEGQYDQTAEYTVFGIIFVKKNNDFGFFFILFLFLLFLCICPTEARFALIFLVFCIVIGKES